MKKSSICTLLLGAAFGAVAGGALVKKLWLEKYRKQKIELSAVCHERELLYNLLKLKQNHVSFSEYFTAHGLQTVAVLGMGREGRYLLDELAKEKGAVPVYGVEADYLGSVHETLTVYRLGEDALPSADCLVVCDLNRTEDKMVRAEREFPAEVLVLEDIVHWLMEKHKIRTWQGQSTSLRSAK